MIRKQTIRGLYGIADAGACNGDPVRGAAQLLDGGCRVVQLRCKGWAHDDIVRAGHAVRDLCATVTATFILNDHYPLVPIVGAHGVHIGQKDASPEEVRAYLGSTPSSVGQPTIRNISPTFPRTLTISPTGQYGPVNARETTKPPRASRHS